MRYDILRNMVKIIAIAGGTGAGKSTLCIALQDKYPEIGLVQLDDYFKPAKDIATINGIENWDHPDSLYLDKLASDLQELSKERSVVINTKSERLNPDYRKTKKRIPVRFDPKPIMLVEGFLVLYDERIRSLLTTSIWLDVPHDIRWARRIQFKDSGYEEKVLKPMQKQYVEPTRQYAAHIIDVSQISKEDVLREVEKI